MNAELEQELGRAIFREANDAFVIVHPADLQVVEVNPAFQRLTGFRRKQVIGLALAELVETDSPGRLEDVIRACQTTSCLTARGGYFLRSESGRRVPIHVTVSRIHIEPNPLALLVVRDVSDRVRAAGREQKHRALLEQLAKGQSLTAMLETITAFVEQESTGSICSILLLDETGRHLLLGSAPRLPDFYNRALHGIEIGPTVGSCGTAAITGCTVIVEDIEAHPLWAPYRELARRAGLRSCWSEPIVSSAGRVLGTLAVYHAKPHTPTAEQREIITIAAHLAGIAIARDRSEKTLRESEERFRLLVDGVKDHAIFMLDPAGRVVSWNAGAERITGWTAAEILGQHIACIGAPEDSAKQQIRQGVEAAAVEGNFQEVGERLRKDGTRFWAEVSTTAIRDDQGQLRGFARVTRDITERKRAEKERTENEERTRLAYDTANIGFFDWNVQTDQVYYSPRWKSQLGYQPEEIVGSREAFESRLHPGDRGELLTKVRAYLAAPWPDYSAEFRLQHKDGTYRWIFTRAGLILDGAGRPLRMLGTHLDITGRKAAEEEKRKLAEQLQHTQKLESLGVLAGGIAHDFNNLLTSILGYSDLALLELPSGSPARPLIGEAINGAHRAAELTKQMLAYSGKGRFVVQPVNLSTLTEDMTRLLQVSISKKSAMTFRLMPDVPAIEADTVQMRQIVMNLVINASEAIGDRSGVIAVATGVMHCDRTHLSETYLDDDLPEGLYVYLEVADNGCGMSEETRARIFDPFFTTKFTGRGLGLSAVLGIVRGHRGALKIYSELGKGTTFKVLFPATTMSADLPGQREPGPGPEWRGSGTVLIADDEEGVRGLARRMLESMGFTVLLAADGREGVEIFRRENERIRLVLLDLTMPHLDGEQSFREMLRIRSNVRVVLMSGYNEQTATSHFVGEGIAAFIQKPYSFAELTAVVRKVLENEGKTSRIDCSD
jgi:PAS domain S-box-containing protein